MGAGAIFALFLLAASTPFVRAQAVSGNIIGTITDSTGAAVANAQISITDRDRGTTTQATSNDTGNYSQTHLLAGRDRKSVG